MKKATLTIGLFTLVMVLTSFTTPETSTPSIVDNTVITSIDGTGSQDAGGNRKHDYTGNSTIQTSTIQIAEIDGTGSQDAGGNRKHD
jgi:hypothetical protein